MVKACGRSKLRFDMICQWLCLQASGNGGQVATFDEHQVFVWPADAWEPQGLELSVPKVVSVSNPALS